jgi:DNA-directed RNA polymerase subunit RPC12/RpoP
MAEGLRYVCGECAHAVEAWSDGNPYYIDGGGAKLYAYHPDHDSLAQCIGNDDPHLCLSCGREFMVDARAPIEACPKCGTHEITPAFRLGGRPCPYCKTGVFAVDPDFCVIS